MEYKTTQQFSGLLPTFTKPDSSMFNTTEMVEYLNQVVASKINTAPVADAYWEGKNVHPLAISALMADQLGETEIREKLLKKLKSIMVDWFTYDGEDDDCYLIYNKDWEHFIILKVHLVPTQQSATTTLHMDTLCLVQQYLLHTTSSSTTITKI